MSDAVDNASSSEAKPSASDDKPSDPSAIPDEPQSDGVRLRALRQVEYYLSDESLPFDEYLKSKWDKEMWLSIEELAGFPKMLMITKSVSEVVEALKASDMLEVSSDGTKVRRVHPTPDKDPAASRTVHVSGFKCADAKIPAEIEARVSKALEKHGDIESVRALRNVSQDTRALDGSAFVVYKDEKAAQLAASATGFVSEGRKINVYAMADWFERLGKKRASMRKKKDEKKEEPTPTKAFEKDAVLSVSGLQGTNVSREMLRALCEPHACVKYIEFERGQPIAYLRLAEGQAPTTLQALGDTVKVGDCENAQLALLTGDEEQAYWQRADDSFKAARRTPGGMKRKSQSKGNAGQRKKVRH